MQHTGTSQRGLDQIRRASRGGGHADSSYLCQRDTAYPTKPSSKKEGKNLKALIE
jgi:hypothetical protein